MKLIRASDIIRLNALSSSILSVSFTSETLILRLLEVVSVTHFKTLASAGRLPGGEFDAANRTLTVKLVSKASAKPFCIGFMDGSPPARGYESPDGQMWELDENAWADVVALYPADNLDRLEKMMATLAKGKVKTYGSTKEAMKARRTAKPSHASNVSLSPSEMDMPMWDPSRGEWYDQEIETRKGGQDRFTGNRN